MNRRPSKQRSATMPEPIAALNKAFGIGSFEGASSAPSRVHLMHDDPDDGPEPEPKTEKAAQPSDPAWMTTQEVVEMLDVAAATLRSRRSNYLKHIKNRFEGTARLWLRESVMAYREHMKGYTK